MRVVITLEIGFTITRAGTFSLESERFRHAGQGLAPTPVAQGDMKIDVDTAINEIWKTFGIEIDKTQVSTNSSAAGELKMGAHGFTQRMMARIAREVALGAGAIVGPTMIEATNSWDAEGLAKANPNTVLLAGGVDYDEKRVVVDNARMVAESGLRTPVIYTGNTVVRRRMQGVFVRSDVELIRVDNVFPNADVLQIGLARKLIHEVFSRYIVKVSGIARLTGPSGFEILPTPGTVLLATEIFADVLGDALAIDVGGATIGIHSVTDGSAKRISHSIDPEPWAKRTIKDDLGVFMSARQVAVMPGEIGGEGRFEYLRATPSDEKEKDVTRWLAARAVEVGIRKHVGSVSDLFTPTGKGQIVCGKDLTTIRWIIGTGGALARVPGEDEILGRIHPGAGARLLPPPEAYISVDRDYRFLALRTLTQVYHGKVAATFRDWVVDKVGELPEPIEDETPEGRTWEP